MHEFQLIEDAVLTALSPLKGKGVKTLEPYSGQLEAGPEDLMAITRVFPCVYVAAGGLSSVTENRTDTIDTSVVMVVGDRNPRGPSSASRGDGASPGVYAILENIREVLHGQRIVSGFLSLSRQREYPVFFKPADGVCLYLAVYGTRRRD